VTIAEYEDRFRAPAPALYQTFADAQGPAWKRRRRRLVAAVLLGVAALVSQISS